MFDKNLFDARFKGYPFLNLMAALCLAFLAIYSGAQIFEGITAGSIAIPGGSTHVVPIPRLHPRLLAYEDSRTDFYEHIITWLFGVFFYSVGTIFCIGFIRDSGSLPWDLETRARRIVTRLRRQEDEILLHELRTMIPSDWKTARLEVAVVPPDDKIELYLVGPSEQPRLLGHHESLERPAERLFNLFRGRGLVMKKVVYHVSANGEGKWTRSVDTVE